MQKALVLSVGGSSEPLIYSIKTYKPDFIYFLHSKDTREHVDITLKEFDYDSSQYLLKELKNPQSLEESFSKSREIISSLKKDYDVNVDFTGGTKPMVAGLVLAAIGEECKYSYVGSTKGREGRDKDGVGVVVSGFEEIISQKDPYDLYAVVEFNRGMDFFNKYQFTAAKSNFSAASEKLEDENLKELANLYVDLVELYDVWDKFNNLIADKKTLNRYLENQILKKINDSENIRNTLEDEAPGFLSQIEANIEFLKLKISRKGVINLKNVKYYLPDLLNNALNSIFIYLNIRVSYHFNKRCRHIRRRYQAKVFYFYYHSLLSGYTGYMAFYSFKVSGYYPDPVAAFIVALLGSDKFDVFVIHAGCLDEIHHVIVGNGKRRVLAVRICFKVIVVIRKER